MPMPRSTARRVSDETEGFVNLSKQVGIYCSPEKWEMIRRRARKAKMSISRFGELCCRRAASENGSSLPPQPPGHPLELSEVEQRRLYEDMRALSQSRSIVVHAPGGAKATLRTQEVVRFLRLSERAEGT